MSDDPSEIILLFWYGAKDVTSVILLNIRVETMIYIFSGLFAECKVQKNSIYLKPKPFVALYVFNVTFDWFNVLLLTKSNNL